VELVVVLTAQDALALRVDVDVLDRARAGVVAATEFLERLVGLESDRQVTGTIHDFEVPDVEEAAAKPFGERLGISLVLIVLVAENDEVHGHRDWLVLHVVEMLEHLR